MKKLPYIGDYELLAPLGRGGMASVFSARRVDRPNSSVVALKILDAPPDVMDAYPRFIDEANLLALLSHPNIARIFKVVEARPSPYMVMEYVEGFDLRVLLNRCLDRQILPSLAAVLAIVRQAALGLDHAHRRTDRNGNPLRLVHRDVSLSNIMVTRDGWVKVVDFGIARSTISTVRTLPGLVRGKPSYMAPEHCLGREVTHLADVFALGIVLYELATGMRCFNGDSDLDRMAACVKGDYTPPCELDATFPQSLERVIVTALQTEPDKRYPSAIAMVSALDRVAAEHDWACTREAIARSVDDALQIVKPAELTVTWPLFEDAATIPFGARG
jgi:serine/threonine protein kinase